MSEVREDKLFQFIPDLAGNLKPKVLIIMGKQRSINPADGTVREGTSVKLKPNAALQYHVRSNIADYDEAIVGMQKKVAEFSKIFGKGKPGSIVEIPVSRIEKRKEEVNGKMETVEKEISNIGSIPEKYAPKTEEQSLREKVAELEAKVADGGNDTGLAKENEELSEKVKELLADIAKMKAVNAKK